MLTPTVTLVWNPDGQAQFCGKTTKQGKTFPCPVPVPNHDTVVLQQLLSAWVEQPQKHLIGYPKGSDTEHKRVLYNWMMSQGEENDQNPRTWNFTKTDFSSALHGLLNPRKPRPLTSDRESYVLWHPNKTTHWSRVQLWRQIA